MSDFLKKINDFLAGLPMTIVAGVFLLASFILPKVSDGLAWCEYLAWVTIVISGIPMIYLALWRVVHNKGISKISSALLISIAMIAAIIIGDYFASGEVAFIMAIGALLEDWTTDRAKRGLKKLIDLQPVQARVVVNGVEKMVPAESIKKGDVIKILPGETVPVDGTILFGETSVDQSIMTGESLPVDKTIGDEVFCGTINRFGTVDISATKIGEDSSLKKLIRMVEQAEENKAPTQRIADKWASWLVPVAMLIAIIAGIITKDIVRAVTVLVVFCPCALVLATPTAIMGAIGQATKHGVIIKSGEALEKMGKVNAVCFDKTGTLTYGKLSVSDIIVLDSKYTEDSLLSAVASAESRSEHPLGEAIVACAKAKEMKLADVSKFSMTSGKGIKATIDGAEYFCGNEKFLTESKIEIKDDVKEKISALRMQGKASVIAADKNGCIGIIALTDVLRETAPDMVSRLKKMNTDAVLLTGDNKATADYFASKVGITSVRSELLPEMKVSNIQSLQGEGKVVCMIGDGVNDAPALKTADVGVAMGDMGSDIAVDAADIALIGDDIAKIPYLKRLSVATVNTIRGSITLSMTINAIAVTLSVLGLLNPTTGALVHNCGSCFVVAIAAHLYSRDFDK